MVCPAPVNPSWCTVSARMNGMLPGQRRRSDRVLLDRRRRSGRPRVRSSAALSASRASSGNDRYVWFCSTVPASRLSSTSCLSPIWSTWTMTRTEPSWPALSISRCSPGIRADRAQPAQGAASAIAAARPTMAQATNSLRTCIVVPPLDVLPSQPDCWAVSCCTAATRGERSSRSRAAASTSKPVAGLRNVVPPNHPRLRHLGQYGVLRGPDRRAAGHGAPDRRQARPRGRNEPASVTITAGPRSGPCTAGGGLPASSLPVAQDAITISAAASSPDRIHRMTSPPRQPSLSRPVPSKSWPTAGRPRWEVFTAWRLRRRSVLLAGLASSAVARRLDRSGHRGGAAGAPGPVHARRSRAVIRGPTGSCCGPGSLSTRLRRTDSAACRTVRTPSSGRSPPIGGSTTSSAPVSRWPGRSTRTRST